MSERKDAWRPEMDERLLHLRNVERKRWSFIGSALGRSKTAAHRRYTLITKPEDRIKVHNRTWTSEQEIELRQLRLVEKRTIREIIDLMNLTRGSIERKLEQMRNVPRRVHFEKPHTRKIPPSILADRDRRMLADRSITSMLFGDPAPGQSALDRKLALA